MATKTTAEIASTYDKRELIAAAKNLFGARREIVAGALYDVTEPITVEAAKARVEEFRKKEVR